VTITNVEDRFSRGKASGADAPTRGDVARYVRS
jgi:hypothetical protein